MTNLPCGTITRVTGTGLALWGDDIDTDRIMPARFLRVLTFEGLGDHVFEDDRAEDARRGRRHPFEDPARAGATVLFVNRNFGCGSSREHAPQGLLRRGIRAIVGESFAEIFFGNATMLGMPCVVVERSQGTALMEVVDREPDRAVTVDLETLQVAAGDMTAPVAMPHAVRAAFLGGAWDATGMLLERFEDVRRAASRLPYLAWWTRSIEDRNQSGSAVEE
jgi:3-isopropylmalate/(R)-2-methylmalate dehydratase small subunit